MNIFGLVGHLGVPGHTGLFGRYRRLKANSDISATPEEV